MGLKAGVMLEFAVRALALVMVSLVASVTRVRGGVEERLSLR